MKKLALLIASIIIGCSAKQPPVDQPIAPDLIFKLPLNGSVNEIRRMDPGIFWEYGLESRDTRYLFQDFTFLFYDHDKVLKYNDTLHIDTYRLQCVGASTPRDITGAEFKRTTERAAGFLDSMLGMHHATGIIGSPGAPAKDQAYLWADGEEVTALMLFVYGDTTKYHSLGLVRMTRRFYSRTFIFREDRKRDNSP
jgi:hypothetical protein